MQQLGIPVEEYHTYEILPEAIAVSQHHFPWIVHHGDLYNANWNEYKGFDLVMGGVYVKFEEVNNIMNDIRNDNYDKEKLLEALEDYKWLIEFKPFKKLVNTQPISTEELYNACIVYSRWYYYTKCNVGLQKILFVDGWRKENVEDCEHPRIPILTNKKYGFALDEDAWAKCIEDRINKELERYKGLD